MWGQQWRYYLFYNYLSVPVLLHTAELNFLYRYYILLRHRRKLPMIEWINVTVSTAQTLYKMTSTRKEWIPNIFCLIQLKGSDWREYLPTYLHCSELETISTILIKMKRSNHFFLTFGPTLALGFYLISAWLFFQLKRLETRIFCSSPQPRSPFTNPVAFKS